MSKKSLPIKHQILAALPRREYERLLPNLESIALPLDVSLYQSGDFIEDVYFQHARGAPRECGQRRHGAAN